MYVGLAHILSLLALLAYGLATLGYAGALGPTPSWRIFQIPRGALRPVLIAGLVCHLLFIVLTDLSTVPLQRFPHVVSLVSLGLVGTFLVLERRMKITALGAVIAPAAFLFLIMSAVTFHFGASEEIEAEGGLLLWLHLLFTVFSYVLLIVAGGASVALLRSESALKKKRPIQTGAAFPSLVFLDRFHRLFVLFGSVSLALGLFTGTLASRLMAVDGDKMYRRLLWVSPEIAVYAFLMFMIFGRGLRGRRLALATIGGVIFVILSLVGAINQTGGFHGF